MYDDRTTNKTIQSIISSSCSMLYLSALSCPTLQYLPGAQPVQFSERRDIRNRLLLSKPTMFQNMHDMSTNSLADPHRPCFDSPLCGLLAIFFRFECRRFGLELCSQVIRCWPEPLPPPVEHQIESRLTVDQHSMLPTLLAIYCGKSAC